MHVYSMFLFGAATLRKGRAVVQVAVHGATLITYEYNLQTAES